jgi:hypothetical protein
VEQKEEEAELDPQKIIQAALPEEQMRLKRYGKDVYDRHTKFDIEVTQHVRKSYTFNHYRINTSKYVRIITR